MTAMEIARRMAELGQPDEALRAYTLAVHEEGLTPEEMLEAAVYILQAGGDYQLSYACFLNLYRQGRCREETLSLLTGAFYEPNVKELRGRYERNVKLLKKYAYLFRKDFPAFEDLPIRFYPYSEGSYIPFFPDRGEFGEFTDINEPVITRNFFKDLEKPVLAADVFSQYELEYLRDNVRRSEDVGRENHVYLHYTDWGTFCAWLQVLNIRPLLEGEKLVFLIEEEIGQYPIDFSARFGIDYSQFPLKPVALREVTRMIWLSQLSSHNGINFFGEIFDNHPNLISVPAMGFEETKKNVMEGMEVLRTYKNLADARRRIPAAIPSHYVQELYLLRDLTEKDVLLSLLMSDKRFIAGMDPAARIVPALVFQPHFGNMLYELRVDEKGRTELFSKEYEGIRTSPVFRGFKYIKTVAPLRRPTTGYAAAVRYMCNRVRDGVKGDTDKRTVILDEITRRVLNRSYLIDWQDRLLKDSVLVRFEDAKLNPKAVFTALAEFLDIPYAESLTYCSQAGKRDPESYKGDARGFDLRAVYETYDGYANDAERYYLEYFLRDAYEAYGYGFQYYDGAPVDEEKALALVEGFTTIDGHIRESWTVSLDKTILDIKSEGGSSIAIEMEDSRITVTDKEEIPEEQAGAIRKAVRLSLDDGLERSIQEELRVAHENRVKITKMLLRGLHFVNRSGQPLRMMPLLKLDPALLEQPLYH